MLPDLQEKHGVVMSSLIVLHDIIKTCTRSSISFDHSGNRKTIPGTRNLKSLE